MKLITTTALAVLFALPAFAQQNCNLSLTVKQLLEGQFGERQIFSGTAPNDSQVEIWLNDETGTWTALITRPDGISCITASGTGVATVLPIGMAL